MFRNLLNVPFYFVYLQKESVINNQKATCQTICHALKEQYNETEKKGVVGTQI